MTELNYLNYLNLSGYIINSLVTFFATPLFNLADVGDLSAKYQTIITPTGFSFAIWGIIFLSQGIFAIAQMHKEYRSLAIVQDGISYWYFIVCIAQSAWVFAFGYELIGLSTVVMVTILYGLYQIVQQQTEIDMLWNEYWLFKFPFEIHCGWIFAASLLNLNILLISIGAGPVVQFISALVSIGFLVEVAVYYLKMDRLNYALPAVFAWATFGMFVELGNPKELIIATFCSTAITAIRILTLVICVALVIGVVALAVLDLVKRRESSRGNGELTTLTNDDKPSYIA